MNSQDTPLFRPEVSASLSQQWMGAIRLAQPISNWLIVGVAIGLALCLILFLFLGSVTKKARVTGVTIPLGGSISIAAPNAGLLVHSFVKEGEAVNAGQILFELSNARQGEKGEITALVGQQLNARHESLEAEQRLRTAQASERKAALVQRQHNLQSELAQLDQEAVLIERRQKLAQESLSKFQTLQSNGYVSSAQVQQKQEELIDIASRVSSLQRGRLQVQANQMAIETEQAQLQNNLATEQAQIERSIASLQQEIAENTNRKSSLITATQAGIVTTITSQSGQMINGGQVLATLIPRAASTAKVNLVNQANQANQEAQISPVITGLEAHLYAPSKTAGFITPGQVVQIRYAAYPYQKFGLQQGTVTDVSSTPLAPNELPPQLASTILSNAQQNIIGFNSNEALYRIKVSLAQQSISAYGQEQHLKPGMSLEADIVQDRRKIWEWIMEPLLAVTKR